MALTNCKDCGQGHICHVDSDLAELLAYVDAEIELLNMPDPYQDTLYYVEKDGRMRAYENMRDEITRRMK